MTATDCPSKAELTAFHLGDLPAGAVDALATHVETCPRCDQILRQLDKVSDEVIASLRKLPGVPAGSAVSVPVPRQVGDYEILEELGRGGMGVVYKARHTQLHRLVALKMLVSGEFAQEDFRARFRAEAATVARLQHPNIIHIIDLGEWPGSTGGPPVPYFTLEYVDGGSLANLLAGKPQPPRQAADWLLTLARAVAYAHAQGIVHRDLKPANVLMTAGGLLKLCDFGVAKRLTGADLKTRSGLLVGTPEYMAPEQAQGRPAGPAADIYALGALLYTMLTGRPPHQGASVLDTLEQVRSQEPVPPRRLQPAIPRDLETICLKCLSKEPPRRYATAEALADDLERFRNGRTIQARPVGVAERGWKWSRRRPALAALLALSLIVLGIGFPGVTYLWLRAARDREQATQERDEKASALYASDMKLAAESLFQGNDLNGAATLLAAYEDGKPSADLRSWEWYYLDRLCHPEESLVRVMQHTPKPANWVHAVAFSPDGRRLVSAAGVPAGWAPPNPRGAHHTEPGELKVWDVASGACLHTFADFRCAVWSVAFSADGRQIAAGDALGHVHCWDAETYRALSGPLLTVRGGVFSLKYVGVGQWLAVNSEEQIGVWDLEGKVWKWRKDRQFPAGDPGQPVLAVSSDGQRLIFSLKKDGPPTAWDVQTGKELVPLQLPGAELREIAFSPDGQFLALARNHPLAQIWDAAGTRLLNHLSGHTNNVLTVAFGPGHLLATAGEDQTVRLWRMHSGGIAEERYVFRGHTAGVICLAFSPDGTRLASGGEDGSVRIWDTARDPRGLSLRFNDPPNGWLGEWLANLAFAADGQCLFLVGQDADGFHLRSRSLMTGRLQADHPLPVQPVADTPHRDFVFSADGRRLAGLNRNDPRAVQVWDTRTGEHLITVATRQAPARALALSADGRQIAVAGYPDRGPATGGAPAAELVLTDTTSGREVRRVPIANVPLVGLAFSPDGRRLATVVHLSAARPGMPPEVAVTVYDSTTGRELLQVQGKNQKDHWVAVAVPDDRQPLALAFSPNGRRLALAGPANALRVWELTTGRECSFSPLQGSSGLTGVAFSPDGRRLAATGYNGRVKLWDAIAGHELLTLRGMGAPNNGHYTFAARIAFSPDGRYLAANDWDGTVFVWDAGPPR